MSPFVKHTIFLFLALRASDVVNLFAGMWFVPRYVSMQEIGSILPYATSSTFLTLPIFAFAMAMMKELSRMSGLGQELQARSLLRGAFLFGGLLVIGVVSVTVILSQKSLPFALAVASAAFGCIAPIFTDALQGLKRFGKLALIEFGAAVSRFAAMIAIMPIYPLAGYFAGSVALPFVRMVSSMAEMRRYIFAKRVKFWTYSSVLKLVKESFVIYAYLGSALGVSLLEQHIIRSCLPYADSAGYYMVTRFSDILNLVSYPLLMVLFPYAAMDEAKNKSSLHMVIKCSAVVMGIAVVISIVYAVAGEYILSILSRGNNEFEQYSVYLIPLTMITATVSCQTFYTNAEVAAGRFTFLGWYIPIHLVYAVIIYIVSILGYLSTLRNIIFVLAFGALLRFSFVFADILRQGDGAPPQGDGTLPRTP
jgi:O-antigen/teichoic acid export membrane protein